MTERSKRTSIEELIASGLDYCFVAMDFASGFDPVYDEILAPTIADCGMRPLRSDSIVSAAGYVVEEIISLIQASRVVIVDITGANPNVMMELGVAHALRKDVIVITQDARKIPFDVQSRRAIEYNLSISGKALLRERLGATLKTSIHPTELTLREMLYQGDGFDTFVIYGHASDDHISGVFPPVDEKYASRLALMSSETAGIWDLGLAYQKIAWSLGRELPRIKMTDAQRAPDDILSRGNAFVFGGPGANRFFTILISKLNDLYTDMTSMRAEVDGGKKRYRIYKGNEVYPEDQDALLERKVDVGMVLRTPNPFAKGAVIWLAAGIRTFGTEAAIRTLVTPSLIIAMRRDVDIRDSSIGLWAVVKAPFDDTAQKLLNVSIHGSGVLRAA